MKQIALLIVSIVMSVSVFAQGSNPPNVMIAIDNSQGGGNCPVSVRDKANNGNGNGAPRCQFKGVKQSDAVCRKSGDTITWRIQSNTQFTITWKGTNPTGCADSSTSTNGRLSCTVNTSLTTPQSYSYSITANGCVLDPRIIITGSSNSASLGNGNTAEVAEIDIVQRVP